MRAKILAGCVLVCACGRDDAERYDLSGLVVIEDFDEPICGGTFAFLERRLVMLERVTGLPRDPRGLMFHWIYRRDEIGEHCVELAGACAPGRDFYGPLISYSHELVHAHLSRLGRPRVWLVEGMATMLDDAYLDAPDPEVTPTDMLPDRERTRARLQLCRRVHGLPARPLRHGEPARLLRGGRTPSI